MQIKAVKSRHWRNTKGDVFHEDTETCTPVYTTYTEDYPLLYRNHIVNVKTIRRSKETATGDIGL